MGLFNWFKPSPVKVFASAMSLYREAQPSYEPNSISFPSFDREKLGRARELFCDCVRREQENVNATLMKAQCAYDLYDKSLMREALDDVERIIEKMPQDAGVHAIRGSLLYALEWSELDEVFKLQNQVANLRKVLELDPNFSSDLGSYKAITRDGTTNAFQRRELANMERHLKELQLTEQIASQETDPETRASSEVISSFSEVQVDTVDEAMHALFDGALRAVPPGTDLRIQKAYLDLVDAWDSQQLHDGDEQKIREIVRGNLVALAHRSDFLSFQVEARTSDDVPGAQVSVFLSNPMRFIGIRVWRSRDKFFACGNASFR